ncbi:venom phosphodiesterase isoform X1 [Procambarus clarkii]|uniref:venom phosphodiesterase isoform X1 n=2 Tax=Procambarus clarkii TaxID=6728 RepID=UPI003741EE87
MNRRQLAVLGACCMVLLVVVAAVLGVTLSAGNDGLLPERLEAARCPRDYGRRPVLLVSLDGFRADYLKRGLTPTIEKLAQKGVHAPYMFSSYPTVTFPNHYTIVTGLYPESHGIVSNYFYDPVLQGLFTLNSPTMSNASWWGGEPIWNTLTLQGKKSATFFWPGSDADVQGRHPTYWLNYNHSIPYQQRVLKVLEWLNLPAGERPDWVSLYFDEPDYQGHATGPDSPEVDKQLVRMEKQVSSLVEGLAKGGLLHCVNILLVADHGMAQAGPHNVISLDQFVPEIRDLADVFFGATSRIRLKNDSQEATLDLLRRLSCQLEGMRVFRPEDLPKRLHYSNNRRLGDIVLDLDPGYFVKDLRPNIKSRPPLQGLHGYDYYFPEMNALFVGYGPDLQQGMEVEPFQNIELYNLMCALTSVTPAPNNGTWGALHHLLVDPPSIPAPSQAVKPPTLPYIKNGDSSHESTTTGCEGDLPGSQAWRTLLELTEAQQLQYEKSHLPWGAPSLTPSDPPFNTTDPTVSLLHHHNHVTGYSEALKVPLWTSLTVQEAPVETPEAPWSSDPRLPPDHAATCDDYLTLDNLTMTPLFPPSMAGHAGSSHASNTSWQHLPYLVSNAVAMSPQLAERWWQLVGEMIPRWFHSRGPINVVLGPVFQANDHALSDPRHTFRGPAVPSYMFAIVTRCSDPVTQLDLCPLQRLDALAFIFPQSQPVPNCLGGSRYALLYSAKVRDVELATGLTFYPDLTSRDRLRLVLRVHSDLW